jgi:WD40 repeat protein
MVCFTPGGKVMAFNGALSCVDLATGKKEDTSQISMRYTRWPFYLATSPAPTTRFALVFARSTAVSGYSCPDITHQWTCKLPEASLLRSAPIGALHREITVPCSLMFDTTGTRLLVGTLSGNVYLLDAHTGKILQRITDRPEKAIKEVAVSREGRLAAVSAGSTLWMYELQPTVREVAVHRLGRKHFSALAFHPVTGQLLSASGEGVVDWWNTTTGERLASYDWGKGKPTALAFDATGDRAAVTTAKGEVIVWDIDI